MVKDHSDSERGNLLLPHGLFFSISSKGSFLCIIPDRITHTTAFVTPVVEHWLEWEIAQWVHHEGLIWRPIAPWANTLTTELHLAPALDGSQYLVVNPVTTSKYWNKLVLGNLVTRLLHANKVQNYRFWTTHLLYFKMYL